MTVDTQSPAFKAASAMFYERTGFARFDVPLAAAIEAYEAAQWQPIETAPRDRTEVLLLVRGEQCVGYRSEEYDTWVASPPAARSGFRTAIIVGPLQFADKVVVEGPTKWKPLDRPTPPEAQA